MSYRVLLHPKAAQFLKKADANLRERIKVRLRELENSPREEGERLRQSPFWRLRIGDYRAVYLIDEKGKRVLVLFVDHRSEVYDDFSRLF